MLGNSLLHIAHAHRALLRGPEPRRNATIAEGVTAHRFPQRTLDAVLANRARCITIDITADITADITVDITIDITVSTNVTITIVSMNEAARAHLIDVGNTYFDVSQELAQHRVELVIVYRHGGEQELREAAPNGTCH